MIGLLVGLVFSSAEAGCMWPRIQVYTAARPRRPPCDPFLLPRLSALPHTYSAPLHHIAANMELPSLRDETTWYAIILGSVVGAAVIRTATPPIIRQPVTLFIGTIIKYISPLLVIKLATFIRLYTAFASPDGAIAWLRRHDIVRLWPLKHILMLALYWGANFSCLFIFFSGLQDAGKRAGRLSLINLIVLYAGPHLSVLADIVELAIPTYRRLHASVATTAFFMAVFHVVVASIKHVDPLLSTSKSAFGLIVSL